MFFLINCCDSRDVIIPASRREHEVVYTHKDPNSSKYWEVKLNFRNEEECKPYIEKDGMLMVPCRYRYTMKYGWTEWMQIEPQAWVKHLKREYDENSILQTKYR